MDERKEYGLPEGESGLDDQETKLQTYWNTPFTKVCLGMKVGEVTKFFVLNQKASSLYALIADGKYRKTSLGREGWKKLITGSSLQKNCQKEGFNVLSVKPVLLGHKLESLVTMELIARPAIPKSGLVPLDTIPTHVVTWPSTVEIYILATNSSKPWDMSLYTRNI